MGLNANRTETNATYLSVIGGNIAKKVKEKTDNTVSRINKKGNEVHEVIYTNGLTGVITDIQIEKSEYGKQMNIVITDVTDKYFLFVPVDSKYFDSFCYRIGNVNLNDEVTIKPYAFEPKENAKKLPDGSIQKITGINITQNGKKVEPYFTTESPKNKPFPDNTSGKIDEDDWKIFKLTERKFFCNYIESIFPHKEEGASGESIPASSREFLPNEHKELSDEKTKNNSVVDDEGDDLPFS